MTGWVIAAITVVVLAGLYTWYALIVIRRNRAAEALAGIDVQLQKRHDLIPNVLHIAHRFMEHEKTLFAEIVELRNRAQRAIGDRGFGATMERFEAEKRLGFDMDRLFALGRSPSRSQIVRADGGGAARLCRCRDESLGSAALL